MIVPTRRVPSSTSHHDHQSSGEEGPPLQHLPSTWLASTRTYVLPFFVSVVQRVHSKNELEEVKGLVPEAPPVVGTTDKSQDPVLAQSPASRVDKPP